MVGVNPKICRGILGFYDMSSDEQNTLRVLATRLTKNQKVNYAELHDLKAIIRSVDFIALVIKEDSH